MSNSQKWSALWGDRCEAPHTYACFCMILWGALYYATLYKNKTKPNMRSLKIVSGNVVSIHNAGALPSLILRLLRPKLPRRPYLILCTLYKNKTRPKMRSLKIASGNVASSWHHASLSLILRLLRPKLPRHYFFQKRSLISKSEGDAVQRNSSNLEGGRPQDNTTARAP